MIRSVVLLSILTVAACAPRVPDSGRPAAIAQAQREQAARDAERTATFTPPAPLQATTLPSTMPPVPVESTGVVASSELAALGIGGGPVGLAQDQAMQQPMDTGSDPLRTQGVDASPANAAPIIANNPGLSDEQSFEAVSNRESIESDAERRARQAAARQVVMPSALPTRPADTGPNIVEYALNAPNKMGQEWYSRSIFAGKGKFERNCAAYNSPDAAQRDFLARGGPDKDPRGLDPDGDGFACGWDPAPFLLAAGGN
ncbi:MAG: hypothetical protein KKB02_02215 [Alphaproteobacteria bacterium]|nr:hypothetical protein [Alphaproteobacteria bacterium]